MDTAVRVVHGGHGRIHRLTERHHRDQTGSPGAGEVRWLTPPDSVYPGFPGFVDGEAQGRMAYGDNYDRLTAIKARYDPESVLRNNVNVEPTN